jgi:hypothetical protein
MRTVSWNRLPEVVKDRMISCKVNGLDETRWSVGWSDKVAEAARTRLVDRILQEIKPVKQSQQINQKSNKN